MQGSAYSLRPSGRGAGVRQTGGWGSSGSCSWPLAELAPGSETKAQTGQIREGLMALT